MLAEAERQDAEVEWRVLSATAELAGQQGQHHAAILFGKMAVQVIASSIRFLDGSSRERAVFLNDRLAPFHPYRRWLVPFETSTNECARPLDAASSANSGFRL